MQNHETNDEAGLVTRIDDNNVYVWWRKQRLDELVFERHINSEITCGDIVTFQLSKQPTQIQKGAQLTVLSDHCFTIHIPSNNQSKCWVRTNVIIPPAGSTYFAKEEQHCQKDGKGLQFMAFSKEFGKVACCIPTEHKPDTVYSCLIGRIPAKFDAKLKPKLNTIFFITEHGIKENTVIDEITEIRRCAPWNQETLVNQNSKKEWINKIQLNEYTTSPVYDEPMPSSKILNVKTILDIPNVEIAADPSFSGNHSVTSNLDNCAAIYDTSSFLDGLSSKVQSETLIPDGIGNVNSFVYSKIDAESKKNQVGDPAFPSVSYFRPKGSYKTNSLVSPSITSESIKSKDIQWIEEDDDLDLMSIDYMTKQLGLKLPPRPEVMFEQPKDFSDLSELTNNAQKIRKENGKNFDIVWNIYMQLRSKGLLTEAENLKQRLAELCSEYENLLAIHYS